MKLPRSPGSPGRSSADLRGGGSAGEGDDPIKGLVAHLNIKGAVRDKREKTHHHNGEPSFDGRLLALRSFSSRNRNSNRNSNCSSNRNRNRNSNRNSNKGEPSFDGRLLALRS